MTPTASPDAEALPDAPYTETFNAIGDAVTGYGEKHVGISVLRFDTALKARGYYVAPIAGWTPPAAKPDTALAGGKRGEPAPGSAATNARSRRSTPPPPADDRGADAGARLSATELDALSSDCAAYREGFGGHPGLDVSADTLERLIAAARTVSPVSEGALRDMAASLLRAVEYQSGTSGKPVIPGSLISDARALLAALPTTEAKPGAGEAS